MEPRTLLKFDAYQDRYYRKLMQLPYFDLVHPIIEQFIRQIVAQGAFCMRVTPKVLAQILADGYIRNKMELPDENPKGENKPIRKEVVRMMFGQNPEILQPAEFHKYGYLSSSQVRQDLLWNYSLVYQFGSVLITLRKDRMMHRTTLCFGDSLNFGACGLMIPTRVDRVKATCILGLKHADSLIPAPTHPLDLYGYIAQKISEGQLTEKNFIKLEDITRDGPPLFQFFELQYHGRIDLLKDIERIDATLERPQDKELLTALQPQLEEIGIPFKIWETII